MRKKRGGSITLFYDDEKKYTPILGILLSMQLRDKGGGYETRHLFIFSHKMRGGCKIKFLVLRDIFPYF